MFSISSKTIGAGQILSAINRDNRGAQAMLNADLQSVDIGSDCPAFMIRSMRTYAFERRKQTLSPSVRYNLKNPSIGSQFYRRTSGIIPITFYNYRNHRQDRLAFFARNFFSRQTGGTGRPQWVRPATICLPHHQQRSVYLVWPRRCCPIMLRHHQPARPVDVRTCPRRIILSRATQVSPEMTTTSTPPTGSWAGRRSF